MSRASRWEKVFFDRLVKGEAGEWTVTWDAPSTSLRLVPLPRCAVEEHCDVSVLAC